MAEYPIFTQPRGAEVDISLYPNAMVAGTNVGNAQKTVLQGVMDGIRTGAKEGLDMYGQYLDNTKKQEEINQMPAKLEQEQAQADLYRAQATLTNQTAELKKLEVAKQMQLNDDQIAQEQADLAMKAQAAQEVVRNKAMQKGFFEALSSADANNINQIISQPDFLRAVTSDDKFAGTALEYARNVDGIDLDKLDTIEGIITDHKTILEGNKRAAAVMDKYNESAGKLYSSSMDNWADEITQLTGRTPTRAEIARNLIVKPAGTKIGRDGKFIPTDNLLTGAGDKDTVSVFYSDKTGDVPRIYELPMSGVGIDKKELDAVNEFRTYASIVNGEDTNAALASNKLALARRKALRRNGSAGGDPSLNRPAPQGRAADQRTVYGGGTLGMDNPQGAAPQTIGVPAAQPADQVNVPRAMNFLATQTKDAIAGALRTDPEVRAVAKFKLGLPADEEDAYIKALPAIEELIADATSTNPPTHWISTPKAEATEAVARAKAEIEFKRMLQISPRFAEQNKDRASIMERVRNLPSRNMVTFWADNRKSSVEELGAAAYYEENKDRFYLNASTAVDGLTKELKSGPLAEISFGASQMDSANRLVQKMGDAKDLRNRGPSALVPNPVPTPNLTASRPTEGAAHETTETPDQEAQEVPDDDQVTESPVQKKSLGQQISDVIVPPAEGQTLQEADAASVAALKARKAKIKESEDAFIADLEAKKKKQKEGDDAYGEKAYAEQEAADIARYKARKLKEKDQEQTSLNIKNKTKDHSPEKIKSLITKHAKKNNVDPNLILAMAKQESNFKANAKSHKGAIGPMQLMPTTAKERDIDPYDLEQNISSGIGLMAENLKLYKGDINKALAAYNAGRGAVAKYKGIPPFKETQDYVKNIRANLKRMKQRKSYA